MKAKEKIMKKRTANSVPKMNVEIREEHCARNVADNVLNVVRCCFQR